ncbi:hypothetical protein RvY_17926 [Ramazzottius varieornatus]|uniref:Cadherin domain-containing protein n=1 Tax=Ramazzottius varieornatus TaxID=947166 RepID=A0A1D1W7I5_RAMVA|nr:hypothetical protein RvY_17926 [Ramazzottius varieornatus]
MHLKRLPSTMALPPSSLVILFSVAISGVKCRTQSSSFHALSKRQTFNQQSYQFSLSNCGPGTSVGTVSATSNGQPLGYTLDPASVYGMYVRVDYLTGQITMTTVPVAQSTFTFNVVAATSNGVVSVPVTVTCSGIATNNGPISCSPGLFFCNFANTIPGTGGSSTTTGQFTQPSYTFTATNCASGSTVGTVSATGATSYVISSGNTGQFTISSSGAITANNQLTTGTSATFYVTAYSATGASPAVPVTVTAACSATGTGTGSFLQPSYAFTTPTCTAGTAVGTVTASGAGGSYQLDSGSTSQFSISNTGQITLNTAVAAGTYTVTAYANGNLQAGVPVTVTVTCSGTGGSTGVNINLPRFNQPFYSFTLTSCTGSSTVGSVVANNAASYSIGQMSNFFTVSNSGSITTVGTLSPGVYSPTVVATSSTGGQVAIPITVYVTCNNG